MLALIGVEYEERPKISKRIRRRLPTCSGVEARFDRILESTVLQITIRLSGEKENPRDSLNFARMILSHYGIRDVCLQKNFRYAEDICTGGVNEIDDSIISEKLAGEITCAAAPKHDTAAIFAGRLSADSERALRIICSKFRYVIARAGGISKISRSIREESGISIIENPTGKMIREADAALFLAPPERKILLGENCVAVSTGERMLAGVGYMFKTGEIEIKLPEHIEVQIPEGYPRNKIVAAAISNGKIKNSELMLKSVEVARRGHVGAGVSNKLDRGF